MITINNLSDLTQLEKTVLESLVENLYAEPGFSDVDVHDLAASSGLNSKTIRGCLSSLVQKNYIWISNERDAPFIHLRESKWSIHPQWSKEIQSM